VALEDGRKPNGPLKILTVTSLYPNAIRPNHAVFVENRLRHLLAERNISAKVVAPVPWFPLHWRAFGRYAEFGRVPPREHRFGIEVLHPRYPVIPKVGMSIAPLLMYAWTRSTVARVMKEGYDFDLIDAHYFFPDGVAAVLLGREFGKPVTITARGTDINLIPRYRLARRMIGWAARRAAVLIAVCQALKNAMAELGIDPDRVCVLRNGVDIKVFKPVDAGPFRQTHGLQPPVLLSVGGLIPRKGHDLVIRALPKIPKATLMIAGDGPESAALKQLVRSLGLEDRVRFLGSVPHHQLRSVYSAADVLVLASDREGWPNVLLEAMACGTPVAATNIWGNPEVVAAPEAGRLIPRRDSDSIAGTVRELLADPPNRAKTRTYAERFGWDETTKGQIDLFTAILGQE
jgi:teichuronic acid biosynthesis glycosyltransferase TuaC